MHNISVNATCKNLVKVYIKLDFAEDIIKVNFVSVFTITLSQHCVRVVTDSMCKLIRNASHHCILDITFSRVVEVIVHTALSQLLTNGNYSESIMVII